MYREKRKSFGRLPVDINETIAALVHIPLSTNKREDMLLCNEIKTVSPKHVWNENQLRKQHYYNLFTPAIVLVLCLEKITLSHVLIDSLHK